MEEKKSEKETSAAEEAAPEAGSGELLPVVSGPLGGDSPSLNSGHEEPAVLRILPLKSVVVFPHNVIPLMAGKDWSADTVDSAIRIGGTMGLLAQKAKATEKPGFEDLFTVGTEVRIVKVIRFPDGTYGAVVQGIRRFRVLEALEGEPHRLLAKVHFLVDDLPDESDLELVALGRGLKSLVQRAIQLSPNVPNEAALFVESVQDSSYLGDLVMPYLSIDFTHKQELLEIESMPQKLKKVHFYLTREVQILEISNRLQEEVKNEVGKQQRRYFVKEQMKLLQKELGEIEGRSPSTGSAAEPEDLAQRVAKANLPREAKEAADRELERMNMMQSGAPEYMVSFTYISWLLDIPWNVTSQESIDLPNAAKILNEDHFGLDKVKKRILDFLAVYALKRELKGPILVLVGPPGVGKTSLGKSVARALGRKFVRIALGGVRDEAEIRGHRRTYIGSMPGKIANALKQAGTMDPVILLDEVDKLSGDFRGDPSSALLEVLDSEQNNSFTDHYLNVPLDLSRVLFFATANVLGAIPSPLRDRMEVIELGSYTLQEKTRIAFDHLWPNVLSEHGLEAHAEVKIGKPVMQNVILEYTREAGVRQLKRELAGIARGVAREVVSAPGFVANANPRAQAEGRKGAGKRKQRLISQEDVKVLLGNPPFPESEKVSTLPVGVATGLAWTPVGGDVLLIEAVLSEGEGAASGRLSITGQLGEVMQESVQTALAFLKSRAEKFGIPQHALKRDLHVHFPSGAVKKDGPSAGVAILSCLVGLYTGKHLSAQLAMTGEISLRGRVLPVGGIKEKVIAAHRYGVRKILLPKENLRDLDDVPQEVKKNLVVVPLDDMEQAVAVAFGAAFNQKATNQKATNQKATKQKATKKK